MKKALAAYKSNSTESSVAYADPHKLIDMLLSAAIENLSKSIGFIERKQIAEKGIHLTKAFDIVSALKQSLSEDKNDLRDKLEDLYEFSINSIIKSNLTSDIELIKSVTAVLTSIREGWRGIPVSERGKKANGVITSSISDGVE